MDSSEYKELFLAEAQEYLQTLNGCLLSLEQNPEDQDNLAEMFRVMHSLKGMAGTMGYEQITEVSHSLENFLDLLKSGDLASTSDKVEMLFDGVDLLQKLVVNPENPSEEDKVAASGLLERIKAHKEGKIEPGQPVGIGGETSSGAPESQAGEAGEEKTAGGSRPSEAEEGELEEFFGLNEEEKQKLIADLQGGGESYLVEVTLKEDSLMKSVRAYMVLQVLEKYGDIITSSPSMNDLEQENFECSFTVGLVVFSPALEEIKESLLNIAEVQNVDIKPWPTSVPGAGEAATGEAGGETAREEQAATVTPSGADEPEESTFELPLSEEEKENLRNALNKGGEGYLFQVTLKEGAMMKSVRAYMVLRELEDNGEIITTYPSMKDLDEEKFDRSFLVALVSESLAREEVQSSLLNITDIEKVEIFPWNIKEKVGAVPPPEPEPSPEAGPGLPEETGKEEAAAAETKPSSEAGSAAAGKGSGAYKEKSGQEAPSRSSVMEKTVRVETVKLDELINLVGEMVINRTQVMELGRGYTEELDRCLEQLDRIAVDLQSASMKLRMVPIKQVFDRFPRMVRDISKEMGKEVQLHISGEDTELDRSLINQLSDPLVHLIRNAIDHGLEDMEERQEKGKDKKGNVYLMAHHEGSHVVITVEDDGKGMDPEKIKEAAIKKGVITREEAEKFRDDEAYNLIFYNGFSTSREISEVSGRGVGMDAVKNNIEAMQGSVEVKSEIGEGTRFVLRLPLTLAIIKALMVKTNENVYAVPIENIRENVYLEPSQIKTIHGGWVANLREEVIPIHFLSELLDFPVNRDAMEEYPVVVVSAADKIVGLIVDEMVGQQEVVIKNLGGYLKELKGIAGATVLGDGRVSLIIDVVGLLDDGRVEIGQNSIDY